MRKLRRRFGALLMPFVAPTVLRALARSWKVEQLDVEHHDEVVQCHGGLATLWHGRMLLALPAHRNKGYKVLVSPSDDGSLASTLLTRFGYGTIRGSSNKNPARAIREMLDELNAGGMIVITPDGPRGPRHSVNPGPAWMSRETGYPVLPCGMVCDRAWHMKSWDRFTIPKWGARIALVFGEPVRVAPDSGDEAIAEATEEIRRRMVDAEDRGLAHLGVERDW